MSLLLYERPTRRRAALLRSWSAASLGAVAPWNRLSRDGFSWDSAQQWIRDGRGSWIGVVIDNSGPDAKWVYSNDGGLTFSTSGAIDGGQLTRCALALDTIHDQIYALWEGTNASDGMIVRRYAITRATPGDASTAIASIATARDAALNLILDADATAGTPTYHSPQLWFATDNPAWTHGALLAVWSVGSTGAAANGGEVRASMRALSNSAADNVAANWTAPAGAGAATITQAPTAGLGWSQLFATATVGGTIATDGDPFGVTIRLRSGPHAGDLCVAYLDAGADAYRMARFAWRGTPNYDWNGGVTRTTLAAHRGGVVDADGGYTGKQELTAQLSHDAVADRLYTAVATWAGDGVGGDGWTLVELALGTGVVTTTTVYRATKALSAPTIFVTGGAFYDPTARSVLVTYTDLSAKAAWSRTYARTTPAAAAVAVYGATPVDIPTILPWRDANGRGVVMLRDFNAAAVAVPPATPTYTPPYQGYTARGVWS